jgi:hypothetical protein
MRATRAQLQVTPAALLPGYGANPNAPNGRGETPLQLAVRKGGREGPLCFAGMGLSGGVFPPPFPPAIAAAEVLDCG